MSWPLESWIWAFGMPPGFTEPVVLEKLAWMAFCCAPTTNGVCPPRRTVAVPSDAKLTVMFASCESDSSEACRLASTPGV